LIKKFSEEEIPDDEEKEVMIDEEGNIIDDATPKEPKIHPYITWYEKFSPSLKMGVIEDSANQKRIASLLRFKSNKSGDSYVSLDDYVKRMKDWQKQVFYIAGLNKKDLESSPFMEKFNEKDVEVLYLLDPADEYVSDFLDGLRSLISTSLLNSHTFLTISCLSIGYAIS